MDFQNCPHCNTNRVLVMADGRCPNCKNILNDAMNKNTNVSNDNSKQDPLSPDSAKGCYSAAAANPTLPEHTIERKLISQYRCCSIVRWISVAMIALLLLGGIIEVDKPSSWSVLVLLCAPTFFAFTHQERLLKSPELARIAEARERRQQVYNNVAGLLLVPIRFIVGGTVLYILCRVVNML